MCQLNAAKKIADIISEEWSNPPRPDTDTHKPQRSDDTIGIFDFFLSFQILYFFFYSIHIRIDF